MEFQRNYRQLHRQQDLIHFQIQEQQSDLDIGIRRDRFSPELQKWSEQKLREIRRSLEDYLLLDPGFGKALIPYEPLASAPELAQIMAEAGQAAGVGPMAAVAGAVAQAMGQALIRRSRDVIVENGGDIFLKSQIRRLIGIYAGNSVFSHRLALEIAPAWTPLGICTSSGTVGHSLSYGLADAVVILSGSTALADAVATATGNRIKQNGDLAKAVDFALSIPGIRGALAIKGDQLSAGGQIKLLPLASG